MLLQKPKMDKSNTGSSVFRKHRFSHKLGRESYKRWGFSWLLFTTSAVDATKSILHTGLLSVDLPLLVMSTASVEYSKLHLVLHLMWCESSFRQNKNKPHRFLSYCKIILTSNLSSIWNKKISANKGNIGQMCIMRNVHRKKKRKKKESKNFHHIYKTAAKFIMMPTRIGLESFD